MIRITSLVLAIMFLASCGLKNKNKELIDQTTLGFIDAEVESEETNLKTKAIYNDAMPGNTETIDRAFENAPPMIPHTTIGFFPIKINNNICLTCHMPDVAETVGAVPLPGTHFTNLRPRMVEVNGIFQFVTDKILIEHLDTLNNSYYNCSQCHAPQASVSIDIENLFTPEFREEFGLEKSSLKDKLEEGI
jgi:cytochrome c-type protein NapB